MSETGLKRAMVSGEQIVAATHENVQLLGRLFWYTIGGLLVSTEDLKKYYTEIGIPEKYFPKAIRVIDAFKQATREQENAEFIVVEEEIVNEAGKRTKNPNVRLLVHAVKKEDAKSLPIIGRWTFDPEAETVSAVVVSQEKAEEFMKRTDAVRVRFEELKVAYTDKDIRDTLKAALNTMHPISMRPSGAVYFVSKEYAPDVEKFGQLVERLVKNGHTLTGHPSELMWIPIIDTTKMRELVAVKFVTETLGAIEQLLVEITEIIKEPEKKILPCHYKQYIDALNTMKEAKAKYTELLGQTMAKVDTQLEVLGAQLGALAERIKTKD